MPETIKVPRLGSSLDFTGELPPGSRAWEVAQRVLADASGRSVETIVKGIWPTDTFAGILGRWMREAEPDIVLFTVSSFWVETETLSGRFQQFGRAGRKLADAPRKASVRTVCLNEEVGVAVVGTPFSPDTLAGAKARRRASARKDELRARLRRLCERLGIYHDLPPHASDAFSADLRLADKVHFNEQAHARMGEIDGRALVEVWRRMEGKL